MISTFEPSAVPEGAHARDGAAASVPSGGVRMHQRLRKSVAKPASGPECSVPATGWAGTKMHARRQMRLHLGDDRALDRADVRDDGAGRQAGCMRRGDLAVGADRDAQDDEVGAARRRPRRRSSPRRRGRGRAPGRATASSRSIATTVRGEAAVPCGAGDRRADQPEADDGEALEERLPRRGGPSRSGMRARLPFRKSRKRGDDEPVRLLARRPSGAAHRGRP